MPELAEVEFYRGQWDAGLRRRVQRVSVHHGNRVFRGIDTQALEEALGGARYQRSQASGKQMMFQFSGGSWLGLHLGMTGRLRLEAAGYAPGKHDHLVLFQAERTMVFTDPRQFGRVRFERGSQAPEWWARQPPPVTSLEFNLGVMKLFVGRHRRLPLKAVLLNQTGFPGIGNWMADEILWRAGLDPRLPARRIEDEELRRLWVTLRWVSRRALVLIGRDLSDPPSGWLFNERWTRRGVCPKHKIPLRRAEVGGRTTAWCAECQPPRRT
jgi:formamidopyrimidine-DNA glycosylase